MKKIDKFRRFVSRHKKELLLSCAFGLGIVMCSDVEASSAIIETVEKTAGSYLKILTGTITKLVILFSGIAAGATAIKQSSPYVGALSIGVGVAYVLFIDSIVGYNFGGTIA